MKVGALLAKLAGKAGLNVSDPKYADLLAIASEIPDEDANRISASLMTMDDAKQNLDLKNHWMYNALQRADEEMNKLMDEKGLSLEDKEALNAEKSSYKRIGKLVNTIQNLEAQKVGASAGDKKALQDQINSLTTKIGEIQKASQDEIKRINSEWQGKLTSSTIRSILAGKKFANTTLPTDVNVETAMVLLNRELEKTGAKIINNNGVLSLKQAKDESLDWLNAANEKPTVEQFVDRLLAETKLLAVNDNANASSNANANGNGLGAYVPPVIQGGNQNANQELVNAFGESIKELDTAMKY